MCGYTYCPPKLDGIAANRYPGRTLFIVHIPGRRPLLPKVLGPLTLVVFRQSGHAGYADALAGPWIRHHWVLGSWCPMSDRLLL